NSFGFLRWATGAVWWEGRQIRVQGGAAPLNHRITANPLSILDLQLVVDADYAVHRAGDLLRVEPFGFVADLAGQRDDAVGRVDLDVRQSRELHVAGELAFDGGLDRRVIDLPAGRGRCLARTDESDERDDGSDPQEHPGMVPHEKSSYLLGRTP